jgi:hypothetical protein
MKTSFQRTRWLAALLSGLPGLAHADGLFLDLDVTNPI